ncbi:hypothetical protein E2542_SST23030 [Spatholobus suberectus]|nr:hypothetical protein E2542_SST23030 [Spatholobus suberectus]
MTQLRSLLADCKSVVTQLLGRIKFLLRWRIAGDARLYSEAVGHFSKIVDGLCSALQSFLAECYMHRSAGRIADCNRNRTLALDPTCIQALEAKVSLFKTIRC